MTPNMPQPSIIGCILVVRHSGEEMMSEPKKRILAFLQTHPGTHMDAAIAKATHVPFGTLHTYLSELEAKNEIVSCHTTRYIDGKKIEGTCCRLAGLNPKPKPGPKLSTPEKVS
jgi:hypothetical protein